MSEKWSNGSLDALMSELDRMVKERGDAEKARPSFEYAQDTLREADAVLGLDSDPLADLSVWEQSPAPTAKKEEDVIVRETRYGQEKFETPEPEDLYSHTLLADEGQLPSFMPEIRVERREEPQTENQEETAQKPDAKTKVFGAPVPQVKQSVQTPKQDGLDGQMAFPGYEEEAPAEKIDEKQAEQELQERRSHTIRDFKLLEIAEKYEQDLPPAQDIFDEPEPGAPKKTDERAAYSGPEYTRLGERKEVARRLDKERRASLLQTGILTALEIVMVVLSILAGRMEAGNRAVLYALCLVALSVSVAFSLNEIVTGLRELIRWKPSCKSAAALVSAAALAQAMTAFILPGSEGIPCTFCAAAGLALWFGKTGKLLESYSVMGNFKLCAYTAANHLHTVHPFREKKDSFEVGKNLKIGDPKICYSDKTRFPSDFLRNSDYRTAADRLCKYMIPAALGAALIAALAGWIRTKTGLSALTAFTGTLCVSMPASAAFAALLPIVLTMFHVNRCGGMVVSPEAASMAASMQALALDVLDLYKGKECDLGFEDYHTIRRDEMLMYAATMAFSAGSPISGALRETFPDAEFLPEVKSLIYEERLGLSGYVQGQSVLLGNRNLLINHSVEAPPKSVELRHLNAGKRVLFLAVGNKVAAMFIVSYKPDARLKTPLKVLENNGVHALVYAPDSNLHEDYIAAGFGLTKGEVVLMSPAGGTILRERSAQESENAPAGLMHNGTPEAMLRTVAGALTIHNIQHVGAFAAIVSCGIGWLICFILMLIQGIGAVSWSFACLYTLIWTVISAVLGILQMVKSTGK